MPTKRVVKTETYTLHLSGADIILAIRQELKAQGVSEGLPPDNASVTISIPGGGDWSNTELDVSEASPVEISWTERHEA